MIRVRDCYLTVKCRYGIVCHVTEGISCIGNYGRFIPSRISERRGIEVIRSVRFTIVFRIDGYPDSVGADWLS